ncbi:putative spermidine/putrescine transport system permease protein [Collimonas sp. PA-H2]|uniref:ABC transporter permease n=1 Tax=Collimonas sp. PA-H2 TaxID=1881062 RepID=UPI000C012B11|nr:ABC transporter permease [Collimonas sp. PA-H2]PFH11635.1 putative spermidine/putrescine transport system permease protein [Collimonas sp. PA-H2]
MSHLHLCLIGKSLHYVFGAVMIVFLLAPLIAVVPLSFSAGSFLSYPIPGFSTQWYQNVFTAGPWMDALRNSLIVGVASTMLSTVIGTLAALAFARRNLPAARTLLAFMISPMIVPSVISGLGMYFLFGQIGLASTLLGLVLAHTVLATPFVLITVTATLQGFDMNLLRAAASLGASPLRAFFNVAIPLIAPGMISGALFAFMTSFDEIVVALFISGPGQRTLPRQMFDGIRDSINPSILAMSSFLLLMAVGVLLLAAWMARQSNRHRTSNG